MSDNNMQPLIGKILIPGTIKVITGLAIGGSKSGIDIGALENPVIKIRKDEKDMPYIPGSSLKGKKRALLAKAAGTKDENADKELMRDEKSEFRHLARVFGFAPGNNDKTGGEALLKVRDCYLATKDSQKKTPITEEKMENSINRITGVANPRPLERVLPGTVFVLDMCLDVYNEDEALQHLQLIDLAIQLLNQDYLGGGGTRGNGKVEILIAPIKYLKITDRKELKENNTLKFSFTNAVADESQNIEAKA